jgi:methionyl-tRNA formyltransferase
LAAAGELSLVVREEKGLDTFYADHPDRTAIAAHFDRLAETEAAFFANSAWESVLTEVATVGRGELNTPRIAALISEHAPDYVAVFGCGIVKDPVASVLPQGRTYNLHQGLSPYYRGSGTNFWPFVEGRLGYIGMTLHSLDKGIDTGGILAHERPDIQSGDTMHTIGCRTIEKSADVLIRALRLEESGQRLTPFPQWDKGRLYKRADMTGEAIALARRREAEGVVEEYLKRRAEGKGEPVRLVRLEY